MKTAEIKNTLKEIKNSGSKISWELFYKMDYLPFFYLYCDTSKAEEIILYENLLKIKDLGRADKNRLERYVEVLKNMTHEEESAYKKYIDVWKNYKDKTVVKIASKEVFLIKSHYGFYDIRPRIINSWRKINNKFGYKRVIALDLKVYHKNCYESYTGLNPAKDFTESYEDYSDCHIKSVELNNTYFEIINKN